MRSADGHDTLMFSESNLIDVEPLNFVPMKMYEGKLVTEDNGSMTLRKNLQRKVRWYLVSAVIVHAGTSRFSQIRMLIKLNFSPV